MEVPFGYVYYLFVFFATGDYRIAGRRRGEPLAFRASSETYRFRHGGVERQGVKRVHAVASGEVATVA
jgi:hypothetical protein